VGDADVLECGEFSPLCDSRRLVGCAARHDVPISLEPSRLGKIAANHSFDLRLFSSLWLLHPLKHDKLLLCFLWLKINRTGFPSRGHADCENIAFKTVNPEQRLFPGAYAQVNFPGRLFRCEDECAFLFAFAVARD
jgi:hypothetical protein